MRKVLIILMVFLSGLAKAQHSGFDHQHDDIHRYHIGIGGAATWLKSEAQFAPAVHLHFLRQFGQHRRWGLGLGYEAVFDAHKHNGINILLNYHPVNHLSVNLGPGILFTEHNGEHEQKAVFHTEAVYEFNAGKFHIGPMAGFGTDRDEYHFSVGVHVGLGI